MATSSGSSAGGVGRGRVVRRTSSPSRRRTTAAQRGADATPDPGPDPATNPDPVTNPAADAGVETDPARPGIDALAARRVPRSVPPAPGGVLPTTRRGMLRYRVLPRSVVGVSMLILAFAVGAGFSGVVLFSYYQFRQNQADTKVNSLISGYKGQFSKAEADLNAAVAAARANIATQLKAAQSLQAGPSEIAAITKQIAPSVFFVHTLDASGQPSVGTAFVISSNGPQTLLLTSYSTVAAATRSPGPPVYVSQRDDGTETPVSVRTWDPQYDIALLILTRSGLPAVTPAPSSPAPQPGDRLFVVSGLGSAGASLAQGVVVDVSSSGLELDAPIGTPFQGGPIIDQSGRVIAVGSRTYAPLGFTSQATYFVPYVQAACNKVLSCPGGSLSSS